MRPHKNTIRLLMTALFAIALVPALASPAAACDDRCHPALEITGATIAGQPWGTPEDIHVGWTIVDLVLPDGCKCLIEGFDVQWKTFTDFPPVGFSQGVEVTQVDGDTWVFHNFDGDLYHITFTVYVYCDGVLYPVSISWYQLN